MDLLHSAGGWLETFSGRHAHSISLLEAVSTTIAVIVALGTAVLALTTNMLQESYRRYHNKKAVAGAFLAEIAALVYLIEHLGIEQQYREKRKEMQKALDLKTDYTFVSQEIFGFPVTIYEKCADQIGMLGRDTAVSIVAFYNALNGFRLAARIAVVITHPLAAERHR